MWQALIPIVGTLLDKLLPDPKASAEAKIKLLELQQAGALKELDGQIQVALAQAQVNAEEARSQDRFRAGWRPAIGYVLAAILAYSYVLAPILTGLAALLAPDVEVPALALDDALWELMLGMLGLGVFRTYEKTRGTA